MGFSRRTESEQISGKAISSYASLSGRDRYSTETHCPSICQSLSCLQLHYFWKIAMIHFASSMSVSFQGGKGFEFSHQHWKINYSPHQNPGNFISISGFAIASCLVLIGEIQNLWNTTGYLTLSFLDEGKQPSAACEKHLISNWWQGSQSSFGLLLDQKHWVMQDKQLKEFPVENSHI